MTDVHVREVEELETGAVEALVAEHPFDDYRRHRRIPPAGALAYLAERVSKAAAKDRTARLLAEDADGRPAGLVLLQHLDHDTQLLGIPMAGIPHVLVRADHPAPREVHRALLASVPDVVAREVYRHVSVRLDTSDIAGYQEFTDAGFRLVETLVTMAYDTERRGKGEVDCSEYGFDGCVRLAEAADHDQVAALAERSFNLNRYHLDEDLPDADVGAMMGKWARNYCEDVENCQVWVAERVGGDFAGFLGQQLNRDLERHSGVLVSGRALLAVEEKRGLVGQMLSRAHTLQSKGDYKEADTQLNNYGMIKVTFNLDMDMVRTRYTFHRSF